MEASPEHNLRDETNPSFLTVHENLKLGPQEPKTVDTLKHALALSDENPSENPVPADAAAHLPLASQEFRAIVQKMAMKEAERLYSDRMQLSITKPAEDDLSNIFQTGFTLLKGGLKNNSYVSIGHVLAQMARDEALDDLFHQSMERRT